MKQLKFMLAAATAIGLATAAQAAETTTQLFTDNYDSDTAGAAATTLTGYDYDGETAADNESVVKAGGYNGSANALQVNTGTDPLLRALDYASSANPIDLTNGEDKTLYIDTMVQFTVTPAGDTVKAGDTDKLMIYLAEVTNETGVVTGTNLMVKTAMYAQGDELAGTVDTFTPTDVKVSADDLTVLAGSWYALKVVAKAESGVPVFTISIDDKQLKADFALFGTDATKFPSLKGRSSTTLTYVGFAGEGLVDNLTAYTTETQTTVDFTFTLSWGDGVSAVTYTIAGDETGAKTPVNGQAFTVAGTGSFTINYTLDTWYTLDEVNPTLTYSFAPNGSGSLNLATTKLTLKTDDAGNIVVNPYASASEIQKAAGIESGAFATADTSTDDLQKALNWNKNCNGNGQADINKITFDGVEPTSSEAEAYLLNCDPADLDTAKANFKFPAIVPGQIPAIDDTQYNGTVTVKGKAALGDAEWGATEGAKFFKAFLTK